MKPDPNNPLEIYKRVKELPMEEIKEQKDGKAMEIRGSKKCLEIIAQFVQHLISLSEYDGHTHKLFYDYLNKKHGFDTSVTKYYENYLCSFKANFLKDHRIELFCKFIGLCEHNLPKAVFKHYIQLLDLSGYNIPDLFSNEFLTFHVPFATLNNFLKKVLTPREKVIYQNAFDEIANNCVVKTDITKIKYEFNLELFQIYKQVYDNITNTAALSVNQFFKKLFGNVEQVKASAIADFLKSELGLTYPKEKLLQMIELFYSSEGHRTEFIHLKDIALVYREIVEVVLPLPTYISIGLNASIELENSINLSLERIYNHYSHKVHDLEETIKNTQEGLDKQEIWGIGRMG